MGASRWRPLPVVPISHFLLLLLLAHHLCAPASAAAAAAATPAPGVASVVLARACGRAAREDPNVKPAFCVAALKEAWLASSLPPPGPGGSKRRGPRRPFPRTLPGVAELSVGAALLNASATAAAARGMLLPGGRAARGDRQARACVADCLQLYADAAAGLRDSARAVREGRLDDAQAWISAAMDAPGTCDDGFRELAARPGRRRRSGRTWNPLRRNGKDLFQLTAMALSFVAFLR